ncbi:glycyl-radical enzyme activating protein [Flammeovirga kamogawensis]|uniref:Glycyl-radical enzyme activating protein n=1 Tax=Flammeovirga kamogawensis TaxID=373891 RepID=A0ABX8H3U5_9BACT|nr:glycyl-radical enzyme activating protein [Flammeovirga kamogawensis]MBB6461925.1 pyruvate formate lyase activating enzyme [Flammeovirga kamogawensis]QWG10466.1 glycyl-radical enzyme activating protein [Flammeovirga kamogawensis]TRX63577.1 glycyl-radical enzyme activating protein [Flammeovirga kamogawensis]
MEGIITNIQRLSVHDGEGIRSVIFFKGCNMRCEWCHNPETFSLKPEIERVTDKCIACGECVKVCNAKALFIMHGKVHFNKKKCNQCLECATVCYAKAMNIVGNTYTAALLYKKIEKDIPFFQSSNGGITISGGEPFTQFKFLKSVVEFFKKKGLHITIESNFSTAWQHIQALIPYVDHWMIDLKMISFEQHKKWTGIGNSNILKNIKLLDNRGESYELRTPVVPSVNSTKDDILLLKKFVDQLINIKKYQLNPFHPLGGQKYINLSKENKFAKVKALEKTEFDKLSAVLDQ